MKVEVVVVGKSRPDKAMRYIVERLSVSDSIMLSSPVEHIYAFQKIRASLDKVFGCELGPVETGHIMRGTSRVPVVRCRVDAGSLDFSRCFK